MFDPILDPAAPLDGPASSVAAAEIRRWQERLTTDLETGAEGLSDAGRVDAITALEDLIRTATAAQAEHAIALQASRRAADAEAGVIVAHRGRGVASMVAHARRVSPHRGRQLLGLAAIVATELPFTRAAWRRGLITEWTVTLVARETACLTVEHRMAVDEIIAADAEALSAIGTRELVARLWSEAEQLDVAACVKRRRRAEADRRVSLRPVPDAMTWFSALLPVKDGVALYASLVRSADTACATGDPRSRGQVMADTLVGRVVGGCATDVDTVPVQLGLVMSDQTLFGASEEPAHVDGYGPVPAELAREIVAGALAADEQVWIRRLYTHPGTGELVGMDAAGRRFRGSLTRFIHLRDRVCRTPYCDAPIRHLDHVEDHADGGATSARNGQGLCAACNHAKQGTGWRARPGPGGEIVTELPTGHAYRTRPPAIATVRDCPPLRIELLLAGGGARRWVGPLRHYRSARRHGYGE